MCWAASPLLAQDAASQPTPPPTPPTSQPSEGPTILTADEVKARLSRIEAATDVENAVKVEAAGLYRQALDQLTQADAWRQKAEEFRKGREDAPALLKDTRDRLQQLTATASAPATVDAPEGAALEDLSRLLSNAEAELTNRKSTVSRLDDEATLRTERRQAIPNLLSDATARLDKANRDLSGTPAANVAPQVQLAQRTLLTAQRMAAQEEVRAYQEEQQFYDARSDVLAARRDEARLLVSAAETQAEQWRKLVAAKREAEAAEQRERAEAELRRTPPTIRELAKENTELAKELDTASTRITEAQAAKAEVAALQTQLSDQFKSLKSRSDLLDAAQLVGPLMRKQRTELHRMRRFERELEETNRDWGKILVRMQWIGEETDRLFPPDEAIADELERLAGADMQMSQAELTTRLQELFRARRDILQKLNSTYDAYSKDLSDLVLALRVLLTGRNEFAQFIDEHVLWIRSANPIYDTSLNIDYEDLGRAALLSLRTLWLDMQSVPWPYSIALIALLVLVSQQVRFRRELRHTCEAVVKPLSDQYIQTVWALLATAAISLPAPLLLWFSGWRLEQLDVSDDATAFDLTRSLAIGLKTTGTLLFVMLFIRHTCRNQGVAIGHFRWDAASVRVLRRHLLWFAPTVAPLIFLVVAAEAYAEPTVTASIGRMAFIAAMIMATAFVRAAFHPRFGVLSRFFAKRQTTIVARGRWIGYLIALGAPPALLITSAAGYQYTAVELTRGAVVMCTLTAALILVHAMAVRGVFYTQRSLAIEEARKRRAEQAAAEPREEGEAVTIPEVTLDEAALNIGAIGEQTRKLLSSFAWLGFAVIVWYSWAALLPALSFLQNVTLWKYTTEAAAGGDGAAAATSNVVVQSITLANLLLAILVLVVTVVLARNTPGLLEIMILRRLPIDAGGRFAVSTVSRYVITVVGLVVAFGTIGIGWSKVQWLIAAMTVGLGFGLQEIFANLVSGLILLFERPIRIGDTVTVGDITGTVSRMRIRATTITNWDRKELIIPNKEFVTGQVVNWTLSDTMIRLIVPVGVAYGSDVKRVKQVLLDIAKDNPRILDTPKPQVWFLAFGDSTLNFEVRGFVKDLDDWLLARDALHFEIDAAFREAGIEIAFPQMDLHVRSIHQPLPLERGPERSAFEPAGDVDADAN